MNSLPHPPVWEELAFILKPIILPSGSFDLLSDELQRAAGIGGGRPRGISQAAEGYQWVS